MANPNPSPDPDPNPNSNPSPTPTPTPNPHQVIAVDLQEECTELEHLTLVIASDGLCANR